MQKAGTLGPVFARFSPLLMVSLLGQHTQSVIVKVTLAFGYLLFCGQRRVLGAVILPRMKQNRQPPCYLEYAVLLCPLSSGKSLTLTCLPQALTMLEQEGY